MEIPLKTHFGVRGLFRMDAVRPDGSVRELAPWQDNLITDIGLNTMGGWRQMYDNPNPADANGESNPSTSYCWVGTGSTPPTNADVAPAAYKTSTRNTANTVATRSLPTDSAHFYGARYVFQFPQGAAAGVLAEVGLSNGRHTGQDGTYKLWMFSRALIKNANGDPITVTVLPDEILQVTYELRHYIDSLDVKTFNIMDGTTARTVTCVPWYLAQISNEKWIDGGQTGASTVFTDYAYGVAFMRGVANPTMTYPNQTNGQQAQNVMGGEPTSFSGMNTDKPIATWGSRTRKFRHIMGVNTSPAALDNVHGWFTYGAGHGFQWCGYFNPPFSKSGDEVITLEWEVTWGRYTP